MSSVQLKVNRTTHVEDTVEVAFPSFYKNKDGEKTVALFSEEKAFRVWSGPNVTEISSFSAEFLLRIEEKFLTWEKITELEFRVEYEKVLNLIVVPTKRKKATEEIPEDYYLK